jgi:hypothetical protein
VWSLGAVRHRLPLGKAALKGPRALTASLSRFGSAMVEDFGLSVSVDA